MCDAAASIWPLLASTPAAGDVCFSFSSDLTHLRRGQCDSVSAAAGTAVLLFGKPTGTILAVVGVVWF